MDNTTKRTVADHVSRASRRKAKANAKAGIAHAVDATRMEQVILSALNDAGIAHDREVTELEFMFMAPQLAKLVLFPDTAAPRAIALLKQELPLTLQSGRLNGSINRSLRQAVLIKGAAQTRSWVLPGWRNVSNTGSSGYWAPNTPSVPPVGQQNFGSPVTANPNGNAIFFVNVGQTTSGNGDAQNVLVPTTFTIGTSRYYALPCAANDTLSLQMTTLNTDANRFRMSADFIIDTGGTLSTNAVQSALLTGDGNMISATITAPTNAVGVFAYTVSNQGVVVTDSGPANTLASLVTSTNGDVAYPAGGAEQMANIMAVSDKARITAQSLWIRNDTPELYRQGEVAAYQPRDQDEVLPTPSVETLGAINYAYNGQLALGLYGFLAFWASGNGQTSISLPWEDLDGHDSINVVDEGDQIVWALKVNPSATEQTLVAIIYSVVEYKSTNSFVPVKIGRCDILACEMTANFLSHIPNIMSNDGHWSKIMNFLKGKAGKVLRGVATVMKDDIVPVAGPALLKAIAGAAML